MKKYILTFFLLNILFVSCENVGNTNSINRNSDLDNITFIIDLKVNEETNEDLDTFIQEITDKVLNTEDFCLEYAYYVSEDRKSVTLYEKYIDSKSGVIHGQNFMSGPFFDRFFNLFTLEKFIVTGPATDEFKKFTSENGFVIEYRESVDGFIR
jgi:quinol monooxygenase YgiN